MACIVKVKNYEPWSGIADFEFDFTIHIHFSLAGPISSACHGVCYNMYAFHNQVLIFKHAFYNEASCELITEFRQLDLLVLNGGKFDAKLNFFFKTKAVILSL